MIKKLNIILVLAMLFVLFILTGCGSKEHSVSQFHSQNKQNKIIVGYAQLGSESAWRNANSESVKKAAEDAGISLIFKNAEGDQKEQIKAIKEFIIQQVDVIAIPPLVDTGWDDILKEAKAAEIPVIIIDRMIKTKDPSLYTAFIGANFYEEGVKAAKWLINNTKKGKTLNIVQLEGLPGSTPAIDRKKGFADLISQHSNMKILESVPGDFIRAKGKEIMISMLKKYDKKIDVLYSHNDEMALGAIEAIEDYGLIPGKDILIISVDGQREALQAIIDGKMNVTVECTPLLGPDLMKAVLDLKAGKKLPKASHPEEGVFTIENAAKEIINRQY